MTYSHDGQSLILAIQKDRQRELTTWDGAKLHPLAGEFDQLAGAFSGREELDRFDFEIALEEHFGHPIVFMRDGDGRFETVDATDHFVHGAEAELGHILAHLLGDEEEEVDDVLRLPGKARAQDGVLSGNADRTGVEVALAHHDAAHSD